MKPLLTAVLLAAIAMPASAQDALLGRNLAASCANCHGTNGHAIGEMKPLAGVSAGRIFAMLTDFKSGAQPGTIMPQIAKGYSDEQIKALAAHFAAQQSRR
ncbi:Cytochrome C [Rubrivivax sp. A210]|uniref:c-type cytochrome n=1 Tax=Rubrivivax sp. A210 TaxID=2772301 RepID=UPI00191B5F0C|nr:c-type cytochrome [Rubrivivax sp. A210]CAD5373715.1 Cytochrome C [Rubrivivax sp. A210]